MKNIKTEEYTGWAVETKVGEEEREMSGKNSVNCDMAPLIEVAMILCPSSHIHFGC